MRIQELKRYPHRFREKLEGWRQGQREIRVRLVLDKFCYARGCENRYSLINHFTCFCSAMVFSCTVISHKAAIRKI